MSTAQPVHAVPCHLPTFQLLNPVSGKVLEVLQRVDAQSAVDVESYVRALGNKRYLEVKEARLDVLLQRARAASGVEELDDTTVRRNTNLASAEASRAKKEFIMDELYSQLKKKTEDAVVLAEQLRKMLALVEQLSSANRHLEGQLRQQRLAYESYIAAQQPLQTHAGNDVSHALQGSEQQLSSFEAQGDGQQHVVLHGQRLSALRMEGEQQRSDFSEVMDGGNFSDHQSGNMNGRVVAYSQSSMEQDGCLESMHPFDASMDYPMKIEQLLPNGNSNIHDGYEMAVPKICDFQGSFGMAQPEVSETITVSVSNPNNQFTVAG